MTAMVGNHCSDDIGSILAVFDRFRHDVILSNCVTQKHRIFRKFKVALTDRKCLEIFILFFCLSVCLFCNKKIMKYFTVS